LRKFAFERIIIMNVLRKNLLFMAAAATVWAAAMQPSFSSAQSSGIGGDGVTRLLWRGTDGSISLWKLDGNLNFLGNHNYGPYYGWEPIAITSAANSWTYVLWRYTDNSVSLWAVDPNLNFGFNRNYGPYTGWIAETFSADTNGNSTLRLIWRNTAGQVSVWFLNPDLSLVRSANYGPYFGWNPGPANGAAVKAPTPGQGDPKAAAAMKDHPGVPQSMPKDEVPK
jgi:hypothetical protein